jgi:hypothetical protein
MAETKGFFTRDFGSTVIYPTRLGDSIQLKGLTSGSVNLIVPSVVGGDYTLTLPSIIGTVALVGHTQTISTISDATTVGQNLVKLTNPSAITFPRINADNSVTALSASSFLTAIGGAAVGQTMYIGTTAVTINQASGTLNLAGIGTLGVGAITSTATALKIGTQTTNILTAGLLLGTDANVIELPLALGASGSGWRIRVYNPSLPSDDCQLRFDRRFNSTTWVNYFYFDVNLLGYATYSVPVKATSFISSAPTGGTAALWKFGIRVAATTIHDVTQYIQLEVNGTLYKLALAV